ncbi:pilin [Chitiniphilus purpureus]|uniref:Pilin n=1 Tax=Chitiniphilus purpureus TaxID=2981137 RepID=A0ABY6DSR4_9NEIS|nr:pilin [Chitiniphilus sp. CD1]
MTEGMNLLAGLKTPVSETYADQGVLTIPTTAVRTGRYVQGLQLNTSTGAITATFKPTGSVNAKVGGKTIVFTYSTNNGRWSCNAASLDPAVRPKSCS